MDILYAKIDKLVRCIFSTVIFIIYMQDKHYLAEITSKEILTAISTQTKVKSGVADGVTIKIINMTNLLFKRQNHI